MDGSLDTCTYEPLDLAFLDPRHILVSVGSVNFHQQFLLLTLSSRSESTSPGFRRPTSTISSSYFGLELPPKYSHMYENVSIRLHCHPPPLPDGTFRHRDALFFPDPDFRSTLLVLEATADPVGPYVEGEDGEKVYFIMRLDTILPLVDTLSRSGLDAGDLRWSDWSNGCLVLEGENNIQVSSTRLLIPPNDPTRVEHTIYDFDTRASIAQELSSSSHTQGGTIVQESTQDFSTTLSFRKLPCDLHVSEFDDDTSSGRLNTRTEPQTPYKHT